MYELIEIIECEMTRFIKLKNIDTNMIDKCFDDSAVVSENNFNFMQLGKKYECKIKLFGKPVTDKTNNSIVCKLVNKEIIIGKKIMVEVEIDNNKYYIVREKVKEYLDSDSFNFLYTRKDLIQVNNIIHSDLL